MIQLHVAVDTSAHAPTPPFESGVHGLAARNSWGKKSLHMFPLWINLQQRRRPPLASHVTAGVTTGCSDTCAEIMVRGGRDAAVSPSPRHTNGGFPRLSVDMQEMERESERGH